jgi:SOS-response transcriptional repressor LexA
VPGISIEAIMLAVWLRDALAARGVGQAEISRLLTDKLGRSIDRAAVNKMVKGTRAISADELLALEQILGVFAPRLSLTVPVVGCVRAGGELILYDHTQGELDRAPAPPDGGTETTVAAIVQGDSMMGRADDGDLIYYDQRFDGPTDDLIGRLCVAWLADGRVVVKKLARVNESWLLLSTNGDPISAEIEGISRVLWIRPR